MKIWLWLAAAIACEVTATLSLRAATDHPAWYALVVVGYLASFAAMAVVLRLGAPIGVVYGIWAASGVALTAIMGMVLFDEAITAVMALGIALVMAGVVLIETGSHGHTAPGEESR